MADEPLAVRGRWINAPTVAACLSAGGPQVQSAAALHRIIPVGRAHCGINSETQCSSGAHQRQHRQSRTARLRVLQTEGGRQLD